MSRRTDRPLIKVTLRFYRDNWDIIQDMAQLQNVEPNRILREMLDTYIRQSSALARRKIDQLPPPPAFSVDELIENGHLARTGE